MTTTDSHFRTDRRGRLLVECLVAMLLINASALVSVSLARSAAQSARRAQHTAAAWGLATQQVAQARDSACMPHAASGIVAAAPVFAAWADHTRSTWMQRDITVTSAPSPWLGAPLRLTLRAAWECP